MLPALPGLIGSGNPAEIPHVSAAVGLGIGIDDFPVIACPGRANVILVTHYRSCIYDKDDHLALARLPHPDENAVFGVVKINPLESFVGIVQVPQGRLALTLI